MMNCGFDDLRLDVLGEQVVDELRPGPVGGREVHAVGRLDGGGEGVAVAVREDVDAGLLVDRVAQRHARPGRREVDVARVAGRLGDGATISSTRRISSV